ncbi:3-hydroxyacyl-CoA dehydrogenase / enoyl-CoA hydratase / 3-hydroxybutyryl-CoA epimerase / enoyl-CoA isomerase [Solimonas aquatica]|uniref:3-hydroxyacyl-CoA dehydrogenase / enoyl-CoA hydratase / 3-hydroxybutyryl-CoA epimerase / enoyl-CoA isomerase n=1 Tax=Solimonas aquatica TaxID=489703 RepID=A0A1H9HWX9_9GAMM|nr:fatty acid oxidation complex subunit alpha FadB [Solimonas aquatica]SEQ66705.1 3-hydroxyacyl-CoA dehydrogenase / enoyl-CoA hydratase / 3-hydroxybutyryl-CoA epimerase / enoyl-CoA isomerase [Solimonas aquatica]
MSNTNLYEGQSIRVTRLDNGYAELCFDRQGDAINKFDARTVAELGEAGKALQGSGAKGLIVTSAKSSFIVGADITEFGRNFQQSEEEIARWALEANQLFNAIEDLPFPSVTAINALALGGGFEMALCTDYRVLDETGQVGFPEVKLGLFPGFGGTVRFARLCGADNAIEWVAGGPQQKAVAALKVHAVDGVVPTAKLREAAFKILDQAVAGKLDWQARRAQKKGPLQLNAIEGMMVFETSKAFVAQQAGPNMPAPLASVEAIQKGASKGRDEALKIEGQGFAKIAKSTAADALIGIFLSDQLLKKKAKAAQKLAKPVKQAAVLGAGIMGGGIAYTSAVKGVPVVMKDIAEKQLALGMSEANKLLSKQVERKKLKPEKAGEVLASIRPVLSYSEFQNIDVVVEAVVENPKIKKSVLAEVESLVAPGTIIASNTSSISIDELASALKHPENFLGMHFFNPVHRMPLVEVIYGEKTSKEAIATIAAYAGTMGKTPIVVKNCPGFLVNRILFPYFFGFMAAIRDGADFAKIDKVMEKFGWPMGPAYLEDVVGMDTAHHVGEVLAAGYPDRMGRGEGKSALDVMYEAKRFGQKNGLGFYKYETDPKGKPKKVADPVSYELLKAAQPKGQVDMSDEEIIERHMLPMIIETVRCLDDGIVETPNEADMGLIYGIGFPPFRGGALKYADTLGMKTVIEKCAKYAHLGKLYEPTESMKQMAAAGKTFYSK